MHSNVSVVIIGSGFSGIISAIHLKQAGFPNLFLIQGPNTGAGLNSIEITQEAEDSYNQQLDKGLEGTIWQTGGCQSEYQSKKGKVSAIFPSFNFPFRRFTKESKINDHKIS